MYYNRTTQYTFWTFSQTDVITRRKEANANAMSTIINPDLIITTDDEYNFIRYLSEKILPAMVEKLKCSYIVKATALVYFKRFYLNHSLMSHNALAILGTCVYLACKVEEERRELREIVGELRQAQLPIEAYLDAEFVLLDGLRFHLEVFHAFNPLTGFILDIQQMFNRALPLGTRANGNKLIECAMNRDAFFYFSPSVIAMAALIRAVSGTDEQQLVLDYINRNLRVLPNWEQIQQGINQAGTFLDPIDLPPQKTVKSIWTKHMDIHSHKK
jgi:cyclin H